MRILVLLIFVFQIMFSSLAQAADLRFDPDNDGTDNVIMHEDGKVTVGSYTLPANDGNNEQVLSTDGAGNVNWQDVLTSGTTASGTTGQIQYNNDNNLDGANLFFDSNNNVIKTSNILLFEPEDNVSWDDSQVLHLKLNENEENSVITNYGIANNGSFLGGSTSSLSSEGKIEKSLLFSYGKYISVPDHPAFDITHALSAFAWVKPKSTAAYKGIVGKYDANVREWMLMLGSDSKDLAVSFGTSNGDFLGRAISSNPVFTSNNVWYHVGFVYDNGTLKMYVNGQQVAWSGTVPTVLNNENKPIWVGRQASKYFEGYIDDVRIFNKAISDDEVAFIYNDGMGTEVSLSSTRREIKNTLVVHDPNLRDPISVEELSSKDTNGNLYVSGKSILKGKTYIGEDLNIKGNLNVTGQVNFDNNNDGSPDVIVNQNGTLTVGDYTLPATDGGADQVLATDGEGNLVWVDQEGVTSGAYTLPTVDGTEGQMLVTDGAGNVSWQDVGVEGIDVAGNDGQIQFNKGNVLGASDLIYDDNNKVLKTALVAVTDGASEGAWNLNPTHHWKLNEVTGTTILDSVGNINGVLSADASLLTNKGWIANVMDFNKSSDYVHLSDTPIISGDTFYVAIDFSSLDGNGPIFVESSSTNTYMYNYFGLSQGRVCTSSATAINKYFVQLTTKTYNDGKRHTAVWLYDGFQYKLIVDGGVDNGGETIVHSSSKWSPVIDKVTLGRIIRPDTQSVSRAKVEQVVFGEQIPSEEEIVRWHNQVTEDTSKGFGFLYLSKGFASLKNNVDYNSTNLKNTDEGWIIAEGSAEFGNNLFVGNDANINGDLNVKGKVSFDNNNDGTPDVVVNQNGTLTVGDYTLPAMDGGVDQVLATDGNGNLVWVDQDDVTAGAYTLPVIDGTAGQVLSTDGNGNVTWVDVTMETEGALGTYEYIKITDTKPEGIDGGTFTAGSWQTRNLNTINHDDGGNVTLDANQFTLEPGTYECDIVVPARRVDNHKAKLRNVTDAVDVLVGTNSKSDQENLTIDVTHSFIKGQFTITEPKTFEVQHRCHITSEQYGFGNANDFGVEEVYTVVELRKIVVTTADFGGLESQSNVPVGGIIMWSGAINLTPDGWVLCDGANGTPDMSGQFIIDGDNYTLAYIMKL